jgi:hypothetical protein
MNMQGTATRLAAALLPLVGVLASHSSLAQVPPDCSANTYYAVTDAGTYVYVEEDWYAPDSSGRLELMRDGEVVWSVATWRGCSLGIVICQLTMEYTVDDGSAGEITFDVSDGRVVSSEGEPICVRTFSQMGESLGYLHRSNYDHIISFAPGRSDAPVLFISDYLGGVPSVFQVCECSSNTP